MLFVLGTIGSDAGVGPGHCIGGAWSWMGRGFDAE